MLKKFIAAAISTLMLLCLCSCNGVELGVDNLLRPPRPDKQQEEIRISLERNLGTSAFSLRTPRGSDQQSAVTYGDLYGDSSFEAAVLYSLDSSPEKVRLQVLTRDSEGIWVTVCDFQVADGSAVARIELAKVLPTVYSQILIGTTLYSGRENVLTLWQTDTGEEKSLYSAPYSRMLAEDLDGDGQDEITVFSTLADGSGTAVNMLGYSDAEKGIAVKSSELLNVSFTAWLKVQVGSLSSGSKAVFIDGRTETDTYTTEVVAVISGQLVKILTARLSRNVAVTCRDIDGDGVLEVPVQEILPGYADAAAWDRIHRIDWSSCNTAGLTPKAVSAVNPKWGYIITIPERYVNIATVISDGDGDEWTLCFWDSEKQSTTRKLFTVRSHILKDWEKESENYPSQVMFEQIDNVCYTVEYYGEKTVSLDELRELFFGI